MSNYSSELSPTSSDCWCHHGCWTCQGTVLTSAVPVLPSHNVLKQMTKVLRNNTARWVDGKVQDSVIIDNVCTPEKAVCGLRSEVNEKYYVISTCNSLSLSSLALAPESIFDTYIGLSVWAVTMVILTPVPWQYGVAISCQVPERERERERSSKEWHPFQLCQTFDNLPLLSVDTCYIDTPHWFF